MSFHFCKFVKQASHDSFIENYDQKQQNID